MNTAPRPKAHHQGGLLVSPYMFMNNPGWLGPAARLLLVGVGKRWGFLVPHASMHYPNGEGQTAVAKASMSPSESFIHFGCPRCTAPLKAPASYAGQRRRCPWCQWAIDVPRKSRRTDFEEYTFHDDSAAGVDMVPEIAFECPLCHTRMTAPEDQVGQQVACPDCRTPVTVPAKFEPRRRKQPAPLDAYALCEDYDPASPPTPRPAYIPVYCGRCGTLMQVAPDRMGSRVTCPDCGTPMVVQPPQSGGNRETCSHDRVVRGPRGNRPTAAGVGRLSGARRLRMSMRHATARAGGGGRPAAGSAPIAADPSRCRRPAQAAQTRPDGGDR